MPQQSTVNVQITTDLLDKLAGRRRKKLASQKFPFPGGVGVPLVPSELVHPDPSVREALSSSRRVGNLLLKTEAAELKKVHDLAEALIHKEFSAPAKPMPCQQEREACVNCYRENPQDTLLCADVVDAYSRCAEKAFAMA